MMYYYKQIDSDDNIVALLTCDKHLGEDAEQIEITEAEYNKLKEVMFNDD